MPCIRSFLSGFGFDVGRWDLQIEVDADFGADVKDEGGVYVKVAVCESEKNDVAFDLVGSVVTFSFQTWTREKASPGTLKFEAASPRPASLLLNKNSPENLTPSSASSFGTFAHWIVANQAVPHETTGLLLQEESPGQSDVGRWKNFAPFQVCLEA